MIKQGKASKTERMLRKEVRDSRLSLDVRHEGLRGCSLQSPRGA